MNGIESSLTSQSENISNKYQSAKDNIQQQLKNSEETYNERKQAWITANMQSVDLPARLEALGDISYFSFNPVDENFFGNTIWWASFVITLLFISLETAPVVVKLLTKRGSYDEMIDRIEYENMITQKEIMSRINSTINALVQQAEDTAQIEKEVRMQMYRDKSDTELRNNKIILDKITESQQELALLAIEKWREEELNKLKSTSSENYITTS